MAERVTIDRLGHAGDGIAEMDGTRIFVPFTLPGEVVEIDRKDNRGTVRAVIEPSPDRIEPACRHFGACGGCQLQHMEAAAYRAWKRDAVIRAFALHGIEAPVEPLVATEPGGRRRAVLSAIRTAKGAILGFHRRGSTEIVPIEECPVLSPRIVTRLAELREIAAVALKPGKRGRMTVLAASNGLDIALAGAGAPDRRQFEALARFAALRDILRLTVAEESIFLKERPRVTAAGAALLPIPGGFAQASATAEEAMIEAVVDVVGDQAPVADLFCGIGTFALPLARQAPVLAVEGDAALLTALDEAARQTSGIRPVTTRRRDLFLNPVSAAELDGFGAVVFDPPAAGAKAQAEAIAASPVETVVAVSCNPATLARDARILVDGGYQMTRALPVDQFLWSAEIEVVAVFQRP